MTQGMTARAFKPVAAVAPRAASTTLVLRDGASGFEVLMVRRSANASFMPGSYVFPGGAVDDADASADAAAVCDESAAALAARIGAVTEVGEQAQAYAVAALRECFEECGLWLGAPNPDAAVEWHALRGRLHGGAPMAAIARAANAALVTSALQPWSHWVTPVGLPKRFDTLFFVARAPLGQVPEPDAGETTALAWVAPIDALQQHAQGAFPMEFATVQTMQSLRPFAASDTTALLGHAASQRHLPAVHPRLRLDAQGFVSGVVLPGQPGYAEALRA
jgi:8-oxo-dGTP pyrophosphatase MutT (NUDIX family)